MPRYSFGPFELDVDNERLMRDGVELPLTPKAFAVLDLLVSRAGDLVTKRQLLETVWEGDVVSDGVLKTSVREVRKALDDSATNPTYVRTAHRRGYSFVARVRREPEAPARRPSAETARTPLVGRDAELRALDAWLAEARAGRRHVVFVTGETGLGKTALVEHFGRTSLARGAWVAQGQCLQRHGAGEPYLPVLEALGRLCREPGRERLLGLLRHHAPTWLVQMPSLVGPADRAGLQRELLGATSERMLREMCELLEVLTGDVDLVLVLEDLHWSDYSTIDLVSALARRDEAARLLVMATYRPGGATLARHPLETARGELVAHGLAEHLTLEFLTGRAVGQYLARRFPGSDPEPELVRWIRERTSGNPLFMVSMVDYLLERGVLREDDGGLRREASLDGLEVGVPENLQQLLEQQLEVLPAEELALLEAASVVGRTFSTVAVSAAIASDPDEVESLCEGLARRGQMIRPAGVAQFPDGTISARWEFVHSIHQSVLHERISEARRCRLHARIGERGEQLYGESSSEIAAELAAHFEQARLPDRAIPHLRRAAHVAARRYSNREAVTHLSRALEIAEALPDARTSALTTRLREELGTVQRSAGSMDEAVARFEDMARAARERGEPEDEVRALLYVASASSWFDVQRCREATSLATRRLETIHDPLTRAHVRSYLGYYHLLFEGWRDEDARACEEAVKTARGAGDEALLTVHVGRSTLFLSLTSQYGRAIERAEEGLEIATRQGNAYEHLLCRFFLAWALVHQGDWGRALHVCREGIDAANRNGHRHWSVLFRLTLAWVHVECLDHGHARALCEPALAELEDEPPNYPHLMGSTLLARALLGLGSVAAAIDVLETVRRELSKRTYLMGWMWNRATSVALADARRKSGEADLAAEEAARAAALVEKCRERTWRASAAVRRAEAASDQGRPAEALEHVRAALGHLEGVAATPARWETAAASAGIFDAVGRTDEAAELWESAWAALNELGNSLRAEPELRGSLLASPRALEVRKRTRRAR